MSQEIIEIQRKGTSAQAGNIRPRCSPESSVLWSLGLGSPGCTADWPVTCRRLRSQPLSSPGHQQKFPLRLLPDLRTRHAAGFLPPRAHINMPAIAYGFLGFAYDPWRWLRNQSSSWEIITAYTCSISLSKLFVVMVRTSMAMEIGGNVTRKH